MDTFRSGSGGGGGGGGGGNVVRRMGTNNNFYGNGRSHGAPYCGHGYGPLRFGGIVVVRMGTQQQLSRKQLFKFRFCFPSQL